MRSSICGRVIVTLLLPWVEWPYRRPPCFLSLGRTDLDDYTRKWQTGQAKVVDATVADCLWLMADGWSQVDSVREGICGRDYSGAGEAEGPVAGREGGGGCAVLSRTSEVSRTKLRHDAHPRLVVQRAVGHGALLRFAAIASCSFVTLAPRTSAMNRFTSSSRSSASFWRPFYHSTLPLMHECQSHALTAPSDSAIIERVRVRYLRAWRSEEGGKLPCVQPQLLRISYAGPACCPS